MNNGWENLKSIIKIESTREFKNREKETEKASRYYISNLENNVDEFQTKIRSHWAVENKLHWTLDVAFSEDASRKRAGNAAQNYSILLKIALNLLKNESSKTWIQCYLTSLYKISCVFQALKLANKNRIVCEDFRN